MSLQITPINLDEANAFVAKFHRGIIYLNPLTNVRDSSTIIIMESPIPITRRTKCVPLLPATEP